MRPFLRKLLTLIITLFIVSLLAFLAFQIISGDPTTQLLGTNVTPEAAAALRTRLGLDRPVLVRYGLWLSGFVHGDMGTSYSYNLPVSGMIAQKLPVTAALTGMAFLLMVAFSLPLGIYAARKEGGFFDRCVTVVDQVVMSVPAFFLGILLMYSFGILLRLFVPGDFIAFSDSPGRFFLYLFFPALSIALPRVAMTVKMLRASILDQMGRDYVRTAYSRGSTRRAALHRHVLRNAILPVITFIGVSMAEILAGSIIIEQVFTVPGIGRLLLASISSRDYPVVQAIVVILAAWVVAVNALADLINQYMDPRLRLD
ncbi:MAG: ABC transporter permease [Intestinimonas sp.]|jgi:ABC-type dipeptide/oligopeptide/nickel transport system permease component|nr:ABC transporter permease [Intestinimonas sp.]